MEIFLPTMLFVALIIINNSLQENNNSYNENGSNIIPNNEPSVIYYQQYANPKIRLSAFIYLSYI